MGNYMEYDVASAIMEQIVAGRKKAGLTQEQLATQMNVTFQAVSKWENGQSCPDITLLPKLASLFDISLDALFGRHETAPCDSQKGRFSHHEQTVHADIRNAAGKITNLPWADDNTLRGVVFYGQTLLNSPCESAGKIVLELHGKIHDLSCQMNVRCEDVDGDVNATGTVTCGAVGGNVNANGSVTCDEIGGDVSANGSVTCDEVGGDVTTNGSVTCDEVGGDVTTDSGAITCDSIDGDVTTRQGVIKCDEVGGDVTCHTLICDQVEGDATFCQRLENMGDIGDMGQM